MMTAESIAGNLSFHQPAAYGVADWEAFFEGDPGGVIPLVRQARARDTLMKCSVLVVDSLFPRKADQGRQQAFLRLVREVIGPDSDDPTRFDKSKDDLVEVFRCIKADRIERANADARPRKAAKGRNPRAEFCEVVADVARERLDTVRAGLTREDIEKIASPVPFLLSEAFADHFHRIVADEIAPAVAGRAKTIIRAARDLPPGERGGYFKDRINEHRNRQLLWDAWQAAWQEAMQVRDLPEKPKPQPKPALGFLKTRPEAPFWRKEVTQEEWKKSVRTIRAANRRAEAIAAKLYAPNDDYDPPLEKDGVFLMEMFGRSPKAIGEQMNALRQIAAQGGDIGRTFDLYRRGKHLDLALMACCFRFPKVFLDGKASVLKRMLSGYLPTSLPKVMPYTVRYLGAFLD